MLRSTQTALPEKSGMRIEVITFDQVLNQKSQFAFSQEESKPVFFKKVLPLPRIDCLLLLAIEVKLYSAKRDEEIRGILLQSSHCIEGACRMGREKKKKKNSCFILFLCILLCLLFGTYTKSTNCPQC